jgi:hypothetical protein
MGNKLIEAMKKKMPKMPNIGEMQALASTQSSMMKTQIVELQKQSNYLERWAIAQESTAEILAEIAETLKKSSKNE